MNGYTSFIFASDLHGNLQDKRAVSKLKEFTKAFSPDLKIFGGDLFDLRALLKKANEDDKATSITLDVDAGMRFLDEWRPNVWLHGNHDLRLDNLMQSRDAVKAGLAAKIKGDNDDRCHKMGIRQIPYDKRNGIFKVGKLKMLHGYACGINAARKHAWTYGSCLFGHVHSIDHVTLERVEHTMARCVGGLCLLDMDYNLAQIGALRHAHGFAYGHVHKATGNFEVFQARSINGKWIVATNFEEL